MESEGSGCIHIENSVPLVCTENKRTTHLIIESKSEYDL